MNKIFLFMASNRCHNRITKIEPVQNSNSSMVKWDDGSKYIVSQNFVYDKDEIRDCALRLTLQYKFLENYQEYNKNNVVV